MRTQLATQDFFIRLVKAQQKLKLQPVVIKERKSLEAELLLEDVAHVENIVDAWEISGKYPADIIGKIRVRVAFLKHMIAVKA